MPAFRMDTQRKFDCYMIVEPRRAGSVIGYLAGAPITETVIDLFGRRFAFAGIAPRNRDGRYDLDSLRPGEFIVKPGMLYRMDIIEQVRQKASKNGALRRNYLVLPADVARTGKRRKSWHEFDFVLLFALGVVLGGHLLFLLNTG